MSRNHQNHVLQDWRVIIVSEHIITESMERILRIEINRPEKKNALTMDMYGAIAKAINEGEEDPSIRVILLHGQKEFFSAGNDISGFQGKSVSDGTNPLRDFSIAIKAAKKPLVAAVNGFAIGVGMTMLLHFDLVYAGTNAKFRAPFVDLAICPDAGSTYTLPRMLGHHRATEIFLFCDYLTAEEAYQIGFVNKVFPDDELLEKVIALCQRLALKPPAAVRLTKKLLKRYTADKIQDAGVEEFKNLTRRLTSRESREVFKAFFERRKPDFSKFE